MNRRNFLQAMLAAGTAPAIIPIANLMRPIVHKRPGSGLLELLYPGDVVGGVDQTWWESETLDNRLAASAVWSRPLTQAELQAFAVEVFNGQLVKPVRGWASGPTEPRLYKPVA